jgi:hypothetical protein
MNPDRACTRGPGMPALWDAGFQEGQTQNGCTAVTGGQGLLL